MAHLLPVWCAGLLSTLAVLPAAERPTGENAKVSSRQSSKPVRVGGVEFGVAAEATWERPAEIYGAFEPGIALRINNRTDRDLSFDLGGTLRLSLKTADGPELTRGPVPERHLPKPVKVAAGKSETVTLPLRLVHTRIRDVRLGASSSNAAGTNWLTGDVRAGKYRLCLSLENAREGDDAWLGKMRTETLEIEVKVAK